jgi:hypothetical protein
MESYRPLRLAMLLPASHPAMPCQLLPELLTPVGARAGEAGQQELGGERLAARGAVQAARCAEQVARECLARTAAVHTTQAVLSAATDSLLGAAVVAAVPIDEGVGSEAVARASSGRWRVMTGRRCRSRHCKAAGRPSSARASVGGPQTHHRS